MDNSIPKSRNNKSTSRAAEPRENHRLSLEPNEGLAVIEENIEYDINSKKLSIHESRIIDALYNAVEEIKMLNDRNYFLNPSSLPPKHKFVKYILGVKFVNTNSKTFYTDGCSPIHAVSKFTLKNKSTINIKDLTDACKIGEGGGGCIYF